MSALVERTNGRFEAVLEKPRTLSAQERLEALCDSGSLHVIRSTVLPTQTVAPGLPGRRRRRRRRADRGPPGVLLRAGRPSSAARSARPTRTRSCGCSACADAPRAR